MQIALFSSWQEVISGLLAGTAFGFLLRRGHLTRFSVIVNQLRLQDFTVMKVMMTALISSATAFMLLHYLEPHLALQISSTTLFGAALGGAVFGIGMALLGYCPGTAIGSLAEGAKDVWAGIIGMVVGAGLYAECYTRIQETIKPDAELTTITLDQYMSVEPWVVILPLLLLALGAYVFLTFRQRTVAKKR